MAMRRLLWSVLAILFILQVADVVTSNAVLASQVGAWEVNPVMRGAMEHFGSLWWLPKAAFGIVSRGVPWSRRSRSPAAMSS